MDDETRKEFARVNLGICAIEGMALQLLLNDAIQTGDEATAKEFREIFNQIEESFKYYMDEVKRG